MLVNFHFSHLLLCYTCLQLDRICHEVHIANKAYPSPLNYYKFPKSVCTSVNEVICHGIPDMRPLEDGDIVNIDVSSYFNGFHGDLNETFFVGNVDEGGRNVVRTAFACLTDAIAMVRPGTMYRDLGKTISKTASSTGCSVVRTYCGHGIGELFHTAPNVPHYAKNKAKGVMQAGHIFTIEPMINEGKWNDQVSHVLLLLLPYDQTNFGVFLVFIFPPMFFEISATISTYHSL